MTDTKLSPEHARLVRRICKGPVRSGKYPETITTSFPAGTRRKIGEALDAANGWSMSDFIRFAVETLIANPGLEVFDFPPDYLVDTAGNGFPR